MKYYIDDDGIIYGYEDDGSQDELIGNKKEITEDEVNAILNPPPSQAELVAASEVEKQVKIDQANTYMNDKQWPGKAAIGRLKDAEKAQYNLWLDYLDALEVVDTSSAPDINWPAAPEV